MNKSIRAFDFNRVDAPTLTLVKTTDPIPYRYVGDVITYTYELTNSGDVPLEGPFTVEDDMTTQKKGWKDQVREDQREL